MNKKYTTLLSFYLSLFILISFLGSCRPDAKDDLIIGKAKDEFDMHDQIKIGDAIDNIITNPTKGFNPLPEEDYQEMYTHLNMLMQQLTNVINVEKRDEFEWKITVLDNEEVNTFITPSGHLYIHTGMLEYIKGEHELVGMIAHEVAYADSDILIEKMKNEYGAKNLSKVLSNESNEITLNIANTLKNLVFEEESIESADEFSTSIICQFAWDGNGLLAILERGGGAQKPLEWLQSKPVNGHRLLHLKNLIGENCGVPDATFTERYLDKIIHNLP